MQYYPIEPFYKLVRAKVT